MDGYHLPRSGLSQADLRRRGAPHTFDIAALQADLRRLRLERKGVFPGWDHAVKDPQPDAIRIDPNVSRVLLEGNYFLLKSWQLQSLFDVTVFLSCDLAIAMQRVEDRLVDCGIVADRVSARSQVVGNDRLNAAVILADGCADRADFVVNG
jgi:pantothenate kinase